MPPEDKPNSKHKRGFASMSLEKRTAIAKKGGASVPASKRSFSKDRNLASEAGRKGGEISKTSRYIKDRDE